MALPSGEQIIVIDAGRVNKRKIEDLKKGRGELVTEVASQLERHRASLGADAKTRLVPVVVVYRRRNRNRGFFFPIPFPPFFAYTGDDDD